MSSGDLPGAIFIFIILLLIILFTGYPYLLDAIIASLMQ